MKLILILQIFYFKFMLLMIKLLQWKLYMKKNYLTNKPDNYNIWVILSPSQEIVYSRNHIKDYFLIFKPDSNCVYYYHPTYFRYSTNTFLQLNLVFNNIHKYKFSVFLCRFCFWIFFIIIISSIAIWVYRIFFFWFKRYSQ